MTTYEIATMVLAGYSALVSALIALGAYVWNGHRASTRESFREQGKRIGDLESRAMATEKALVRVDGFREDLLEVKRETKQQTHDLGALKIATAGIQGQLAELTRRVTPSPTAYSKVPR